MHDLTLILAIAVVAFLAYQAEVDDRPPADQEPPKRARTANWKLRVGAIAIVALLFAAMFLT
ncbi:hypothetical protein GF108_18155 [Phyllobacterium sp. SYP-B3895]|uniref:Uncharacterized protein n=1 Tax=Phyllobacterium pellucidum TaxID=2740464 RepID=A0A849VSA3_9HYPH|nr:MULTISPECIES: hypothetical protein [Phyllobacterium]MRG57495.1 hypothetical protein [Phyllobacterium sp. SYP-B3895]NTS32888.1 hypothetical protein [Phyllobacterium pellucidum]SFJ23145.1 hypothetical protein SAMN04515648_3134 [Phyllobacterium sp. CL33Tsu]